MPAFLGQNLILQLDRGGAGVLQIAHQTHDIERLSVAGVAVDNERQVAGPGN